MNTRKFFITLLAALATLLCRAQAEQAAQPVRLAGFTESPYWGEQLLSFTYEPGVSVHINAPSAEQFDASKPTRLMIFALPNTNRTHWCIGKKEVEGDDFHFRLLHIGGQTRFIRSCDKTHNFVTIYLEPDGLVWGKWRRSAEGRDLIIRELVDYLYRLFADYHPQVELNGHSGGGSFIFGFIEAKESIPEYVKRISFIDSNYNWAPEKHARKLEQWLEASEEHRLSVICYDDGRALTAKGKPVIDRKDGTGYRTKLMMRWAKRSLDGVRWKKSKREDITELRSRNSRRAYFFYRHNPERKIYHAPLGELNGYIHSALVNTDYEGMGYEMMGKRAYEEWIQPEVFETERLSAPPALGSLSGK